MPTFIDLAGKEFGRLTVIGRDGKDKFGGTRWKCKCECGNETSPLSNSLRSGATQSCGCLQREAAAATFAVVGKRSTKHSSDTKQRIGRAFLTHGHTVGGVLSRTYRSWAMAKKRCTNPKHDRWADYGGRGIGMCERWLNSFENFLADMGERPEGKSLDRYPDNDGNYEPNNCRWATPKQQANNRRAASWRG